MISVIVPVYKVEQYLRRCVDSILAQTYTDFELLLVDDGSPDQCPAICDEYGRQDRRIRVFHKPNGGLSDARNYGLERMKGDYVTFIDSDDYVGPDYLKIMLEIIEENHVKVCDIGHADTYDKGLSFVSSEDTRGLVPNNDILRTLCQNKTVFFTAWGKLFHKDLFSKVIFPVGYLYEDNLVIPYILCECETIAYSTSKQYYYFQRADGIVATFSENKLHDCEEGLDKLLDFTKRKYPQDIEYMESRVTTSIFSLIIDRAVHSDQYFQYSRHIKEKYGYIFKKVWKLPVIPWKRKIKVSLFMLSSSLYKFLRSGGAAFKKS